MQKPKILLIYTGGTIGMMKDFKTNALKAFNFNKLLKNIPELQLLNCEIETISFDIPIDSSNMKVDLWVKLTNMVADNYYKFDGFVILHGSDTMAYTASALSFMIQNLEKPVILTGSQLPIGDLRTDAKENLITAIQIAALQENNLSVIQEVCLYFEYKLYRGNRTTKISADHFNAFQSPNYPPLAESGVNLKINKDIILKNSGEKLEIFTQLCQEVIILKLFPGLQASVLEQVINTPNIKGMIIETFGSGNAPNEKWFLDLMQKAIEKNIFIINVTQCSSGSVNMGVYETGTELKKIGIISGYDTTIEAAITKLMYLLGKNLDSKSFKMRYETDICGEISKNNIN
jgi:L-asparaginase